MSWEVPSTGTPYSPNQSRLPNSGLDDLVRGYAGTGILSGGAVTYSGSGDTLNIAAGVALFGQRRVRFSSTTKTGGWTSGSPFFVVITVSPSGTVNRVAGSAGSAPIEPDITAGDVKLAVIYCDSGTLASNRIYDRRIFLPDPRIENPIDDDNCWTADEGYDVRFNGYGTSLPSPSAGAWVNFNMGSNTFQEANGVGVITAPGDGADPRIRGICMPLPTPSTYYAVWKLYGGNPGRVWTDHGIFVSTGTGTGSRLVSFHFRGQAQLWQRYYWFAYNSFWTGDDIGSDDGARYVMLVKESSSSYDFWTSRNGLAWAKLTNNYDIQSTLNTLNGGTAAATHLGIMIENTLSSGTVDSQVACEWFKLRSGSPPAWPKMPVDP